MFSQSDEEKYILEYFKDQENGRFLDIGAYNGKTFSNTHALALKGWAGVCIEASSKPFSDLVQLYKDNLKIELVNAAVLSDLEEGGVGSIQTMTNFLTPFYDSGGDATSSLSAEHRDKWNTHSTFRGVWVQPIYMSSIERRFGSDYDFINIDIEGISFDVAMGLVPWDPPQMICIEHDEDRQRTKQLADCWEMEEIHRNAENVILARPKNE